MTKSEAKFIAPDWGLLSHRVVVPARKPLLPGGPVRPTPCQSPLYPTQSGLRIWLLAFSDPDIEQVPAEDPILLPSDRTGTQGPSTAFTHK